MAWGPGSQIAFQIFMHCESGLGHTRCEVMWNNQKMRVSNLIHGPGTQRKVGGLFACGGDSVGKESGAPGGEGLGRSLAVGSRLRLAVSVLQSQKGSGACHVCTCVCDCCVT